MKVTSYQEGSAGVFVFTAENLQRSEKIIARYPADRTASALSRQQISAHDAESPSMPP